MKFRVDQPMEASPSLPERKLSGSGIRNSNQVQKYGEGRNQSAHYNEVGNFQWKFTYFLVHFYFILIKTQFSFIFRLIRSLPNYSNVQFALIMYFPRSCNVMQAIWFVSIVNPS